MKHMYVTPYSSPSQESHSAGQEISRFHETQRFITVFTRESTSGPYPEPYESSLHLYTPSFTVR